MEGAEDGRMREGEKVERIWDLINFGALLVMLAVMWTVLEFAKRSDEKRRGKREC